MQMDEKMWNQKKKHSFITFQITAILLFSIAAVTQTSSPKDSNNQITKWLYEIFNRENVTSGFGNPLYEFAYDDNSVQLVIGINHNRQDSYYNLLQLITDSGGEILREVTLKKKVSNLVVDLPLTNIQPFLTMLETSDSATYIEPNWKIHLDSTVNDPYWKSQWGSIKIGAAQAWNTQKGESHVLVAVIDTGIDYDHPDLAANYVPLGYDWVNNDADPMDDHGHGTHCAGIIAAAVNNSVGIAGIAQVKIMAEKGFNSKGDGQSVDLANAIIHAVDQGANIISCSWGDYKRSFLIYDAIKYAYDAGALIVAAAGNDATKAKSYPAAYNEVIAVVATDTNNQRASFSNFGTWIELAAPGVNILSTVWDNSYKYMSGTSMAAPYVSGVAALIWSQFPNMSRDHVRALLRATADDLGEAGFDEYYGYGLVNAEKAVKRTMSSIGNMIINAGSGTVYFVYNNPQQLTRAEATYDAVSGAIIYGLCKNTQHQGFVSTENWLLESGAVNSSTIKNSVIAFFGGPCTHKAVEYYENSGLTPVKFEANISHYMFVAQNGTVLATLSKADVDSGLEDLIIMEILRDSSNTILIIYGFDWKGTWAGGICFKELIVNNFSYDKTCYIFHWIDSQPDGVPESSEIHLVTALN
jgi:hypothetical protein